MSKRMTVQGMLFDGMEKLDTKMDRLEAKVDAKFEIIMPVLEGLKVKTAIAGGIAGVVGTAIVTAVFKVLQ